MNNQNQFKTDSKTCVVNLAQAVKSGTIITVSEVRKKVSKIATRKATGFESLQVNYWEINQVTSKCQKDFLDKTFSVSKK